MLRLCVLLLLFVNFTWPSLAETVDEKARRERLVELRGQEEINKARLRELGGSEISSEVIRTLTNDIYIYGDKADRIEQVAKTFAKNEQELRDLQQKVRDGEPFTLEDAAKTGAKVAAQSATRKVLEWLAQHGASKVTGVVGKALGAAEFLANRHIRHVDADKIREMMESEHANLLDVLHFVSAMRQERNATMLKLQEAEEIQKQQQALLNEIAELNRVAVKDAVLKRDTDAEGDELLRKEDEAGRLCRPANRKTKGRVGSGGTLGLQPKQVAEEKPCRLIDGKWLLTWTKTKRTMPFEITYTGPEYPGPEPVAAATFMLQPQRGTPIRCTADGMKLLCETRYPQPPTCPTGDWPEWQKRWDMVVPTEGTTIAGVWEITLIVQNPPGKPCRIIRPPVRQELAFTLSPLVPDPVAGGGQ